MIDILLTQEKLVFISPTNITNKQKTHDPIKRNDNRQTQLWNIINITVISVLPFGKTLKSRNGEHFPHQRIEVTSANTITSTAENKTTYMIHYWIKYIILSVFLVKNIFLTARWYVCSNICIFLLIKCFIFRQKLWT